jgi:hypothetical protein
MEINGEACPIVSIIEKYVFHFWKEGFSLSAHWAAYVGVLW